MSGSSGSHIGTVWDGVEEEVVPSFSVRDALEMAVQKVVAASGSLTTMLLQAYPSPTRRLF